MHGMTLTMALIVALAASGANAATYSSPLNGTVETCCAAPGPWFGDVTVTTNEDGDGLFTGAQLQSITVSSEAYPGPGVVLLDFYSDGFGVGVDGSAATWPTVTISNGQVSDIEELYTGGGAQWDFSGVDVSWSTIGGSVSAAGAIGSVPEPSGFAMLLLGLAAMPSLRRSLGMGARQQRASG